MRENLRLDESLNTELLKTPERALKDEEMKQIGAIAAETGDVQEVKEYFDLVKNDAEFADAVGETEERRAADFFLAEARAAGQANDAIEQITPLPDGSINVELNPAQLTQAIDSFRTADAFEQFQSPASSEKSIIGSLSLEDIRQTEQFLAANNQISDALNNQVFIVGNDLMKTLQPPMSQTEQQIFKELTISQETQSRFAEISRSERFLDDMERQAEVATQNQIPFEQTARNFTFVNPSEEAEAKEMKFWENDRQQREDRIARENAQKRLTMTDAEKAEQDAIALDEAIKDELAHEQEGLVQVL